MNIDLLNLIWSPNGHMTVQMAAVVTIIATQWLKHYLPDWRFTQLLALLIAVGSQMAAVALAATGFWFEAFWTGVMGATVASFGYELLANLASFAGIGPRKE